MSQAAQLLNFETWLAGEECYKCAVKFAIPASLQRRLRETGDEFFCPNGHGQVYKAPEIQKLRDELRRVREQSQRDIEWQRGQRRVAEKQLIAKKGQITKLKNRISKGVCPCCNRSFADLHRHMTTKHPDYTTKES